MVKKIGLTFASLFLVYNTYKLILIFFQLSPQAFSLFAIILLAAALNLMITGIVAFLGFAYPTNKLLPESYYEIKHPKLLQKTYDLLGIRYFRHFLLLTFYRKADNKKYFNGSKKGIQQFSYNTKQSEFGHLIAFLLIIGVSLIILYLGHLQTFLWMQPINIVFNLYPTILQRHHRIRIDRLILT